MPDLHAAAFRTGPLYVRGYRFPHLDAAVWIELLSTTAWPVRLIQRADSEPYESILSDIERGKLGIKDITPFARAVLAEAAGRPWWEAETLVGSCFAGGGRLLGMVLLSGVRPESMTLAAFCCAVWAQVSKGADGVELMKLEAQLMVPPDGVSDEEMEAAEDESMDAMVARMRAMPGARIG